MYVQRLVLGLIAVVVASLSLFAFSGAKADDPGSSPPERPTHPWSGPRVVINEHPTRLQGARQETVRGVRTPEGNCLFNYQLALAPNERKVVHEELAYDPDTCRTLVQIGRDDTGGDRHTASTGTTLREDYPASFADNDGPGLARRLSPQYDGGSLPPPYTGGVITSKGTMYSYAKDSCPTPCITVNSVEQQIEWDWDGANAVYVDTIEWTNWYNFTGWDWHSADHITSWGSYANWTYAYHTAYHHFSNASFPACLGSRVHVYYDPQTVYGYKSGYLAGEVWRTKSGPSCKDLLSFPSIALTRIQN